MCDILGLICNNNRMKPIVVTKYKNNFCAGSYNSSLNLKVKTIRINPVIHKNIPITPVVVIQSLVLSEIIP